MVKNIDHLFQGFFDLKGKARKWFGWSAIIFSDIAYAPVTMIAIKRLFASEPK